MNGESYILDTNIVINHFKDASIYSNRLLDANYFIPRIVVGELNSGAYRSKRPDHHREMIEKFLNYGHVLEIDSNTSVEYGKIWAHLAKKGKMIPTNDIWIAALANQHALPLISNDSHFANIDHFKFVSW